MPSSRIEFSELAGLAAGKARRGMQLNPLDLPRLAELVVIPGGDEFEDSNQTSEWLGTDVRFDDGPEGFPRVHLIITGNLVLECQRCLQPVGWQVEIESQLTVLSDVAQTAELEDPFDSVLMDIEGLNLQVLVEDEILTALPLVPVHGPGTKCAESGPAGAETGMDAAQTNRPFAKLASMTGRAAKNRSN